MKEIQLTQGQVALVDDEDYERVISAGTWHTFRIKGLNSPGHVYAARNIGPTNRQRKILLHRFILNLPAGRHPQVDHKNHNGLDCRKANLRPCTQSGNMGNQRKTRGSSRYKGVSWSKSSRKWIAQLDSKNLGFFEIEGDAARAYNEAAREYYGEFALLNRL